MSDCECPLAGWCERHKINKTEHLHGLCRTNAAHREAFDRQVVSEPSIRPRGLGDVVASVAQPIARLIDRVAGTSLASCGGCQQRQNWLNKLWPK